jgi:hypothetical protein
VLHSDRISADPAQFIVSEDGVLKNVFWPKRYEVTGHRKGLHNDVLHDLNCSPTAIRVIKARRMRWAGHVGVGVRRGEVYTEFWWGSLGERDQLEVPGVDRRIITDSMEQSPS